MPPKKPTKRTSHKTRKEQRAAAAAAAAAAGDGGAVVAVNGGETVDATAANHNAGKPNAKEPATTTTTTTSSSGDSTTPAVGIYGVYKRATKRFKEALVALVPDTIFAMDRVQSLMDAVDFLVEQQEKVDPMLLEDCRTSLQFRKNYSKQFEGGGDSGHGYFILVLNYCYQRLKELVPKAQRKVTATSTTASPTAAAAAAAAVKEPTRKFRFTDLEVESDSEEEIDNDDSDEGDNEKPRATPQRPASGPDTEKFTLEDLIESTDRFKACLFLSDVEDSMQIVSKTYAATKMFVPHLKEDATDFVASLVSTATVTNLAIREVMMMEAELKVECPHLDTFYRVMACVFLSDQIDDLAEIIQDAGKSVSRPELTAFVGDIVELVFRNPMTASEQFESLASDFCHKWKLPSGEIFKFSEFIVYLTRFESMPTKWLQLLTSDEYVGSLDVEYYTWMRDIPYVGGGKSIINTQSLLQFSARLIASGDMGKIKPAPGSYGQIWDEEKSMAKCIRGDMDQLLMEDILPELLFSCQYGLLSMQDDEDGRFDDLLPLFVLLKDFVSNPAKPVPLALTFGVHAILTSIYQVQGDKDVAAIARFAKGAYGSFFCQLKNELDTSELAASEVWAWLVKSLIVRKSLPAVVLLPVNERAEERAFWNPCCAGMFLGYLTYHVNLRLCSCFVDYFQQLRLVLHLENALRVRNLIEDNTPLVTRLGHYFQGVQTIWQGSKPDRNNIVRKFLIINGKPLDAIGPVYDQIRGAALGQPIRERKKAGRAGAVRRTMKNIGRPEQFLESYRNICNRENNGQTKADDEAEEFWNMNFVRRLRDSMDRINKEKDLFSINLAAAAGCCDRFLRVLVDNMEWRPLLDQIMATKPKCLKTACPLQKERIALCEILSMDLLGPLEFVDAIESHLTVIAARDCFEDYFSSLDSSQYEFFKSSNAF